jgi:hypothetical protein
MPVIWPDGSDLDIVELLLGRFRRAIKHGGSVHQLPAPQIHRRWERPIVST